MPLTILDAITRHQIFIQRYAAGREKEAINTINRLQDNILNRIAGDITLWQQARLTKLYLDFSELSQQFFDKYKDSFIKEMIEFANYEVEFNIDLLNKFSEAELIIPANEQVTSVVYSKPMQVELKGYTVGALLSEFSKKKSNQIVQKIKDSILIGDTTQQIISHLQNTFSLQKKQAGTVARTVTNHVSAQARNETYKSNEDILDGYQWISVLDSRTSLICASRDQLIYPISDDPIKSPKPPAHFSCRSTTIPAVKKQYSLISSLVGKRGAIGSSGRGQVSGDLTYEKWLRQQSKSFQDTVLGTARGELFRNGNLNLGNFIDDVGNTYSLNELRKLKPLAFEEAGI